MVASFCGPAGDELVRRLIEQAPFHLEPGGLLALEIAVGQAEGLSTLFRQKKYHDIESKGTIQVSHACLSQVWINPDPRGRPLSGSIKISGFEKFSLPFWRDASHSRAVHDSARARFERHALHAANFEAPRRGG